MTTKKPPGGHPAVQRLALTPPDTNLTPRLRHAVTVNRRIDWLAVNEFVAHRLAHLDAAPYPGSITWCALEDQDPLKVAACLAVSPFWAVTESARQDALRDASHAIVEVEDWTELSRQQLQRQKALADGAYSPRRSLP